MARELPGPSARNDEPRDIHGLRQSVATTWTYAQIDDCLSLSLSRRGGQVWLALQVADDGVNGDIEYTMEIGSAGARAIAGMLHRMAQEADGRG